MISRQIKDMAHKVYGIRNMDAKPDAIFIVDIKNEKTALQEANHLGIPVIAVCDTNVNPDGVKHMIPANDDAVKSISIMTSLIAEAINEGKKAGSQVVNAAAKPEEKSTVELKVSEDSKAVVEDLDLQVHDALAAEKQDEEKNK